MQKTKLNINIKFITHSFLKIRERRQFGVQSDTTMFILLLQRFQLRPPVLLRLVFVPLRPPDLPQLLPPPPPSRSSLMRASLLADPPGRCRRTRFQHVCAVPSELLTCAPMGKKDLSTRYSDFLQFLWPYKHFVSKGPGQQLSSTLQ